MPNPWNKYTRWSVIVVWLMVLHGPHVRAGDPKELERQLMGSPVEELASTARRSGDPKRGALAFFSPAIGCSKCHEPSVAGASTIGPRLSQWTTKPTDMAIVESILRPSAKIEPNYATVRVRTSDGSILTGIVQSKNDQEVLLRTGSDTRELLSLAVSDIDEILPSNRSIMPEGIALQLEDRRQFDDLVAYLYAIVAGGDEVAQRLRPTAEQQRLKIPEYESHVDHAGLIANWNRDSLARGEAIYRGLCVNCHGTREAPGSLPTALRFGQGSFKRGSDPWTMYQTLTHGAGQMAPQIWMVPQQKYDVIQFIREHFLRTSAPEQYLAIDQVYLDKLPKGDTFGPPPQIYEPWATMNYGPWMTTTLEFGNDGSNIAQKGITVRLDQGPGGIAQGRSWMTFEHDTLRWAGAWSGQRFIDWEGIQFNGHHGIHPRIVGDLHWQNLTGPGWANPQTGSFDDTERVVGRNNKRYGPLPTHWGKFLGMHRHNDSLILEYTVGETRILEHPFGIEDSERGLIAARTVRVDPRSTVRCMAVATLPENYTDVRIGNGFAAIDYLGEDNGPLSVLFVLDRPRDETQFVLRGRQLCLNVKQKDAPVQFSLGSLRSTPKQTLDIVGPHLVRGEPATGFFRELQRSAAEDLAAMVQQSRGRDNPGLWKEVIRTECRPWSREGAWDVDELVMPIQNPWGARTRATGHAFVPGVDAMVVCTWDGDVWRLDGLDNIERGSGELQWRRIASGLFQPLGILAIEDGIMVTCRDQLALLHDTNGDLEIDHYECFNSDHQVTEHFHEFAMGLQRDSDGNWYYAKSACHAKPAVVPHHGTLLRVSADGRSTDILTTGFRAANGVCLNPDGSFIVTDQEGHWNPKNRINWVRPGKFYGNMLGYHDVTDPSDTAMEKPICWITNAFDRSPAELLWVESEHWKPLFGQLMNLSYGYGRLYVVPMETFPSAVTGEEVRQGGMCGLPIPDLPTGMIRGRFSPRDGQLYVGGMFAWASSREEQEGGLFRVRYNGQRVDLPIGIQAVASPSQGPLLRIRWSESLDPSAMNDARQYMVRVWGLNRTANYGSPHVDEHGLEVASARLMEDGRTIELQIPALQPTWGMEIELNFVNPDGVKVSRKIHNTIHELGRE